MVVELPEDVLHLVCAELRFREDFSTLFNWAICSKRMAVLALGNLYRMPSQSPGNDDEPEGLYPATQDLWVKKWSVMWRSIILSSMDQTLFPYCKYLRFLDLRDLKNLLEDNRFTGKVQENFFSGSLAKFRHQVKVTLMNRRSFMRLDYPKILHDVGDAVTPKTPLLEQISGEFGSEAFLRWIPWLPRLQRLELWYGSALADEAVRQAIYKYCPNFQELSIYQWLEPSADEQLGSFISGLPSQTLKILLTISNCGVSTETCLALNNHGESLKQLQLNFSTENIAALGLLRGCTAVESLFLEIPATIDLEFSYQDTYEEVVSWIGECKNLREINLTEFRSGPGILTPLLLSEDVHLEDLSINANRNLYTVRDNRDFHLALAHQKTLHTLCLRGDGDEVTRDDIDALVESVGKLKNLRKLELRGVSDMFGDEAIMSLLASLPQIEEVYIGGHGISDDVLETVAALKNLQRITFIAMTTFTVDGLLQLISSLGPGNEGLQLSVDMADPLSLLDQEEIALVRASLYEKVGGRFDYIPMRDPDASEFEGSDSE